MGSTFWGDSTNLGSLVEAFARQWDATPPVFEDAFQEIIGLVRKKPYDEVFTSGTAGINAYVQYIQQVGQGAYITALSTFWFGTANSQYGMFGGVIGDAENLVLTLDLLGTFVQYGDLGDLGAQIRDLIPGINTSIWSLIPEPTPAPPAAGANATPSAFQGVMQQLGDLLASANGMISWELSVIPFSMTCVAASVIALHPESGPTGLQNSTGVKVNPQLLSDLAQVCRKGVTLVENQALKAINSLDSLMDALAPLTSMPYISQAAGKLQETLDEIKTRLAMSRDCYITGLEIMAHSLTKAAKGITVRDAGLAMLFTELYQHL